MYLVWVHFEGVESFENLEKALRVLEVLKDGGKVEIVIESEYGLNCNWKIKIIG